MHIKIQNLLEGVNVMENEELGIEESIKKVLNNFIGNYEKEKQDLINDKEKIYVEEIFNETIEQAKDIITNGNKQILYYLASESENKKRFAKMVLEASKKVK